MLRIREVAIALAAARGYVRKVFAELAPDIE
jgi:hypothetical protein